MIDNIQDLTNIIRQKPDNAEAFYKRGVAYFKQKDYQKSIADFSQVINLTAGNTLLD